MFYVYVLYVGFIYLYLLVYIKYIYSNVFHISNIYLSFGFKSSDNLHLLAVAFTIDI